jgi:DNA-binding IclR family transcriptional regulator
MANLDQLLGPSKYLKVLDLFLENPNDLMNLREIARRLNKNPGSITQVLPVLVNKNYLTHTNVGAKIIAYQLNKENQTIKHLQELLNKTND